MSNHWWATPSGEGLRLVGLRTRPHPASRISDGILSFIQRFIQHRIPSPGPPTPPYPPQLLTLELYSCARSTETLKTSKPGCGRVKQPQGVQDRGKPTCLFVRQLGVKGIYTQNLFPLGPHHQSREEAPSTQEGAKTSKAQSHQTTGPYYKRWMCSGQWQARMLLE